MKILVVSSLYPNRSNPQHGIFIENKVRQRACVGGVIDQKVIAPLPIVPRWARILPRYRSLPSVHEHDARFFIDVYYPKYLVLPKVSTPFNPLSMYLAMRSFVQRIIADGFRFDLIDSHFFYPDGVAA